jgi:ribosomal protein L11 methyltransferase
MTIVARLTCDEPTARRLAAMLGESLDGAVCAAFMDAGGQWQIAVHFSTPPDEAGLRALVALVVGEKAAQALAIEAVADTDWVAASLAGLQPVAVGRFTVHGAHDRARIAANRIGIEIEAALAFGTGHHGTTRGCLLAIDRLAKWRHCRNVLDLGTGSGILAIAVAKVFQARVTATDIDARAVAAARANARHNHVGGRIAVAQARGCDVRVVRAHAPYDLVLANILLAPLLHMATPVSRLVARGGRVVLSGLLPSQANAIVSIYRAQGLTLERRSPLDGWVTLVMRRA